MTIKIIKTKPPYFVGEVRTLSAADEALLVSSGIAEYLPGEVVITSLFGGPSKLPEESIATVVTNTVTGGIESFDVNGVPQIALGVTIDQRDTMGRVSQYTVSGIQFAVTYGQFGVSSITGGGITRTISYNAAGQITEVSNAAN